VFWVLFLFWAVGLGLFGCSCGCGGVFSMLVVGWGIEVVGWFAVYARGLLPELASAPCPRYRDTVVLPFLANPLPRT
jgi:hypothetical protein